MNKFEHNWTSIEQDWTELNTFELVLNQFEHIWTSFDQVLTCLNTFEHIWAHLNRFVSCQPVPNPNHAIIKVVPKKTDIIFLQRAGCYATIFVDDGQLPGRLEFWFGFWGGRPDWWDEILLICGNKTLTVSIQVVFFRLFSSIAALAHVCTCGLCKPNLLST